jgi:hypothetical protein
MKIVLLLGPSSAGKSTLCSALVAKHGWNTHGCDQVGEIIQKERTPLLLGEMLKRGLFEKLSPYMDESAIIKLAETGQLDLVRGDISITHQFRNPKFEGLEAILKREAFSDADRKLLTDCLHEVGDVFESCLVNPIDRMLNDIFKLPPDASVVIDEVPPLHEDLNTMLDEYREKIDARARVDGREIEYALVMAFCPPKALSNRIQHRNESAVRSGDLNNRRDGLFPFIQLSHLISVAEADGDRDEARTLSNIQLLLIARKHLAPVIGESETFSTNLKASVQYKELIQLFKLTEKDKIVVSPREDLGAYGVIDLSKNASPSELAIDFLGITKDIPPLSTTISPPR